MGLTPPGHCDWRVCKPRLKINFKCMHMNIQAMYQVDAFTDVLFRGNPAAVCILQSWLPDATMQAIASENNLS